MRAVRLAWFSLAWFSLAWFALACLAVAPAALAANPLAVAVIVGNKTYQNAPEIAFADRDAQAMRRYVIDVLGYDDANVIVVENAGYVRLVGLFGSQTNPRGQLARRLGATAADSDVFVYFSGHGFPGLHDHKGYLLPVDADAQTAEDTGYSLDLLTANLAKLGARSVMLVLDACFSGESAGGPLLKDKSVLVRPADPPPAQKLLTVLAASGADEMANWDRPDRHGAFTEFFLRAVYGGADDPAYGGKRNGQITAAAVKRYLDLQMSRWTARELDSEQTANLSGNAGTVLAAFIPGHPPARPELDPSPPQPGPVALPQPAPKPPATSDDPGHPLLSGRAPLASFMRSNAGWTASVSLPEPALEMSFRIGEAGAFRSTGLSDHLDQQTGERAPNLSFSLPASAASTVIQLRYQTQGHGAVGPFNILFDPEVELFRGDKRILEGMSTSWVEFAHGGDPLIYFTTLMSYRCAISELRYGLDDAKPLARFDLPSCNAKDPFSIPSNAATYLRVPPKTKSITVQIIWRDGTESELSRIQRN